MLTFSRDSQQTIPESSVLVVGLGGAGANMIDRFALDGMDGAELLALHTDTRVLNASMAGSKVQLGADLTHGLGCGGDPALGEQAAKSGETAIRDALRNYKMVFICTGLGGGTGSGAAPTIARIAREMDAFVVVFATMPFGFEGPRRREQAENALNQLSVVSNALITFDNGRMGELVVAESGVHEAFAAADRMIAESIKAVTRLVVRPGLVNIGLDELVSALRTRKSRCLFGSGLASGANRAQAALKSAIDSPLLDKGQLLSGTETVLVHICGGESMTLYEIELLMRELAKSVPDTAQILFGAAVDPAMGDEVSITLISALPEDLLTATRASSAKSQRTPKAAAAPLPTSEPEIEPEVPTSETEPEIVEEEEPKEPIVEELIPEAPEEVTEKVEASPQPVAETHEEPEEAEEVVETPTKLEIPESPSEPMPELEMVPEPEPVDEPLTEAAEPEQAPTPEPELPSDDKKSGNQSELALDGGPKGRFDGGDPNLFDGEDLDVPPFLRGK